MFFANNALGEKTHITVADINSLYFCPCCNAPMTQRRGNVKTPHFSHKKGYLCTDTWEYEPMSDWHRAWQAQYPLENREVVIKNDIEQHRADVLINHTVIEFQHSTITAKEFAKRNAFYTARGYYVVWLFDARAFFQTKLTCHGKNRYQWKYAPKMLVDFDLYGKVQVFFHLCDSSHMGGKIVRLTKLISEKLSLFETAPQDYTELDFVKLTSSGTALTTDTGHQRLFHTLYAVRRTTGEKEWFGCPMNADGYSPQVHELSRVSCDNCVYCKEIDSNRQTVQCVARFRDHLENIQTILENHNNHLKYVDKAGVIRKAEITQPPFPAMSIPQLARKYNPCRSMIVRNIYHGTSFKINYNVMDMMKKYSGKIYGCLRRENECTFSERGVEIYGAMEKAWIMEWFK